ncbi:MAG: sulfur oxidation c-type cytochrome SoxA [Rhodospirillales bacterium]|nr:sulfur oxidation c-type cytochrome SoxA [Rhodospirillales bacterium]
MTVLGSRILAGLFGVALAPLAELRAGEIPFAELRSGSELMSPDTRAMQDADSANPGMLWVIEGEALWNAKAGAANLACADCHGAAELAMRGVAARHPAFDAKRNQAVNLAGSIEWCRVERQKAPALTAEGPEALALEAYVARQSRGLSIASTDAALRPLIESGRELYLRRQGQLDLSCAHCHTENWGRKLAGLALSQGHPNGYPLYRLEWQSFGSLERRLRNCLTGMRAEPYPAGASEYLALEAYLKWRAHGMPMESPAVRP